jgi:4-hydroxythreonine-4-phosphate dehydrogenase
VSAPFEAAEVFRDAVPVLDLPLNKPVVAGQASPTYAAAVIRWIETAVGLALSGTVRGIVTAPIAKKPLYDAGFPFPGHTEFLADLVAGEAFAGPRGPVMMLAAPSPATPLHTALVTSHCALADVPRSLSIDKIVRTGRVLHDSLRRDFGVAEPRIALAGLNPHAGESGALGEEEIETINPAAAALRSMGVNCTDARSADTLFHEEARRGYDAVVCMYHDQALIPVKTLDFWGGINVTLGLPIVRTSPDHGTGFEIAGRGLARADSLIAAVRAADAIASRRAQRPGAALSVVAA